jgi:hypothetical protein
MPKLLPADRFANFTLPEPFLPASPGHHKQWIEAAKGNGKASSSFDYSGPFTEVVLLGNVAYRSEAEITYDPTKMEITQIHSSNPTSSLSQSALLTVANRLLSKEYRKGWEV